MLEAIVANTRNDVAGRKRKRPVGEVLASVVPSDRNFDRALRAAHPAFILEVKPRSPSAGLLRAGGDLGAVLPAYRDHASAVSVLTDEAFFGGSLALLGTVRRQLPQPILCKDFVVDPYQVAEARLYGADAVLLMLSVLDDHQYRACATLASHLRMGMVTEVHDEAQLTRAIRLGATVVGINNRNLATLTIDLTTTERLAARVPEGVLTIAESGISDFNDVSRLRGLVDGFLVGSVLMGAADPGRATRELIYGPTKVCGLTTVDDAEAAHRLGASHGGLVLAADSPRRVSVRRAAALRAAAELSWAGVFVNTPAREIARLAVALDLTAVQLHGDETRADIDALRSLVPPGTEIWKAVTVEASSLSAEILGVDRILFDRRERRRRGGTGLPFDWSRLSPSIVPSRSILAGGLVAATVGTAMATGIAFLDVSSGVERAPGIKDHERLAEFLAARRGPRRRAVCNS